jgi:hypothetical protein
MASSRELADVVAAAMGVKRETVQLHLRTIRAAKLVAFSGYGRGAARMTSDEASRLVIAVAGSRFAKDSLAVLERFGKLHAVRRRETSATLEEFFSRTIDEVLRAPTFTDDSGIGQFGSPRLADLALQLLEPVGQGSDKLPCHAMVRWITHRGDSKMLVFGPPEETKRKRASARRGEPTAAHDLIERYETHRLFQVRTVRRQALIDIAMAL